MNLNRTIAASLAGLLFSLASAPCSAEMLQFHRSALEASIACLQRAQPIVAKMRAKADELAGASVPVALHARISDAGLPVIPGGIINAEYRDGKLLLTANGACKMDTLQLGMTIAHELGHGVLIKKGAEQTYCSTAAKLADGQWQQQRCELMATYIGQQLAAAAGISLDAYRQHFEAASRQDLARMDQLGAELF